MRRVALPLIEDFQPDVIIIANGLDAAHTDPLARMSRLSSTYAEMTAMVMQAPTSFMMAAWSRSMRAAIRQLIPSGTVW